MAKGKRAAALFEVIQAAKSREQQRLNKSKPRQTNGGGGLLTPSWWFKTKKENLLQPIRQDPLHTSPLRAELKRTEPTHTEPIHTEPVQSMAIVSGEIPADAPPIVKAAKRPSLISSLLSRGKTVVESTKEFDPFEVSEETSVQANETADRTSDESSDEPSSPAMESNESTESSPAEPARPLMRLADDMVDNEEALDFIPETTEPAEAAATEAVESKDWMESSRPPADPVEEETPARDPIVADRKPVKIAIDRQRQQLNFRITYTSAAIGAFGLAAVLGIAVLIGKSLTHGGPSPAGAASIDSIRNGKVFPNVLEVKHNTGTRVADDGSAVPNGIKPATKNPTPTPIPASAKIPPTKVEPANPQPAPQPQPTPQSTAFNGRRIVGMQYVWVQSYPDPEDANDAVAELKKNGIDATAEKGLWIAPTWTTVIGTRAFDHTHNNPEYDTYLRSIEDVSNSFAGTSKFKRFEPRPIGWKEKQAQ